MIEEKKIFEMTEATIDIANKFEMDVAKFTLAWGDENLEEGSGIHAAIGVLLGMAAAVGAMGSVMLEDLGVPKEVIERAVTATMKRRLES